MQGLLNTPHPSGNLSRWGLALQESDSLSTSKIKLNCYADSLSHVPLEVPEIDREKGTMVATIETPKVQAKDRDLAERQGKNSLNVWYLKDGILLSLEEEAKELTLNKDQ